MNVPEEFPPPPQTLPRELHCAFRHLCQRLQASGAEVTELDAIVVARVAQAEASLERARAEAEKSPLIVGSPANGQCAHPAQRLLQSAESNLRAWLKLLPKGSGGVGLPVPHVPSVADVAPATCLVAGGEPAGEPPERVRRLRAMLKEFRAAGSGVGAVTEAAGAAVCAEDVG